MSATISSAEDYDAAAKRVMAIVDPHAGSPEAAEAADLAEAMRKWEKAQEALDQRNAEARD